MRLVIFISRHNNLVVSRKLLSFNLPLRLYACDVRAGPIACLLRHTCCRLAPRDLATLCQHTSLFNVGLGRRLIQVGATYLSGVANRTDHFFIEPVQMFERYLSLTMLIFVNLVTIQSSVTAYPYVKVSMVYGINATKHGSLHHFYF
jgi:hypothetical protein